MTLRYDHNHGRCQDCVADATVDVEERASALCWECAYVHERNTRVARRAHVEQGWQYVEDCWRALNAHGRHAQADALAEIARLQAVEREHKAWSEQGCTCVKSGTAVDLCPRHSERVIQAQTGSLMDALGPPHAPHCTASACSIVCTVKPVETFTAVERPELHGSFGPAADAQREYVRRSAQARDGAMSELQTKLAAYKAKKQADHERLVKQHEDNRRWLDGPVTADLSGDYD